MVFSLVTSSYIRSALMPACHNRSTTRMRASNCESGVTVGMPPVLKESVVFVITLPFAPPGDERPIAEANGMVDEVTEVVPLPVLTTYTSHRRGARVPYDRREVDRWPTALAPYAIVEEDNKAPTRVFVYALASCASCSRTI